MLRVGQKVRYGSKRGVVTYVGMDGSWVTIRTNKGEVLKLIPFNMVRPR